MKKGQVERNELLRYALQHPPPNVTVKLPVGFDTLDNIDLALCPSPLPLYAEAERAAAASRHGKTQTFVFDVKDAIVYIGGSSGGVQRARASSQNSRTKPPKSPHDAPRSADAKSEAAASASNPRATAEAGPASPGPNTETTAPAERHARAEPQQPQQQQQRIVAMEQSPPHSPSGSGSPSTSNTNAAATAGGAAPAADAEQNKGFFGHIVSTFRGLAAADAAAAGSTASRPASAPTHRTATRAVNTSKGRNASPGGSGSLFSSLWNPLTSMRGAQNPSQRPSAASPVSESASAPDTAHRMESLQIPLCGTTPGTMSEVITRQFGPVFEAVEERRRQSVTATTAATDFPRPPSIQLCEVLNSALLTPFLESLPFYAYDNLVFCTGVLVTKRRSAYEAEMNNVYRRVFAVTDEQHRRSLANVTPPALRTPVDASDPAAVAARQRSIANLQGDVATLRLLCDESGDDEYVARTEQLIYCIENYPDNPGDTHVPFAIRAMMYAACLLPLYELDLSTLSPIYTEKDVAHCLALLRARLGISPQTEQYCHLHAQLLANDQCGSVEAQAVFLKDVARAVSTLGARDIGTSELSPPVKYAYYVLQEAFCLAAVPMPWLDSTFSYDMQRSVSAVFIEACTSLPSCMLSAMLLVEDMPVLPPTADPEAFLLAFMEVFVNSGVFRNYAELMDDNEDEAERSGGTTSAVALLQQVGSGLDTKQKAYCKMLTRSFPLAMFIVVPGRVRIGAYILLVRHWGNAFPNEQQEVPKDFQSAMEAFLLYLLGGCGPERHLEQAAHLRSLLVRTAQTYLAPFSILAKNEEAFFARGVMQDLQRMQMTWATSLDEDSTAPPHDVRRFLRTTYDAPRPPPLGSDPSSQQHSRVVNCMASVKALLERCMEGFPKVAAVAKNAKVPFIAAEYERIASAVAARNAAGSQLPGAVHRLHTVVRIKESLVECMARSHRKYELVRVVTGAPAVPMESLQETHVRSIYEAVLQLCDTISIEILSTGAVAGLLERFMRLDAKQYQVLKQSHGKNEDFPMPRAYPDVTMRAIVDEIQRATSAVCARLDYEPAVRQVHYRVGHNFVACLFAVYVDSPGVFLSTADAPLILADLDLVRAAFFGAKPDSSPDSSALDAVNSACQVAAHVLRTSGAELLEKLSGIVQYVMSKPSAELVNGAAGVPPLHTLPDSSDDSPWCQFVVRRVLDHRKDFKKSMWINYQARQRTKTMY